MEKLLLELSDVLDALEQWYKQAKPEHPYNDNFNGPASKEAIDELNSLLDEAELPDEFVQLYERFDGTWSDDEKLNQIIESSVEIETLFDGRTFMPLAGTTDSVISEFQEFQDDDYEGGNSKGPVKRMRFNRLWIPIAKDYSGNYIGVDLDPPSAGTYGQVICFGRDEVPEVLAKTLTEYLIKRCERLQIEIAQNTKQSIKSKRHSKETQLKTKRLSTKRKKQDALEDSQGGGFVASEMAAGSARIDQIDTQILELKIKNDDSSNVVSIFSARSFKKQNQEEPRSRAAKIESISLLAAEVVKDLYESRKTLAPDSKSSLSTDTDSAYPNSTISESRDSILTDRNPTESNSTNAVSTNSDSTNSDSTNTESTNSEFTDTDSALKTRIEKLGKLESLGKKVLRDPAYLEDGLKYLFVCLNAKTEKKRVKAMEQINIIGSQNYLLKHDLPEAQKKTVPELLDNCLLRMLDFLLDGTEDEISESMRTLSDLEYSPAIDEIIRYLLDKQFSTEAAWCIGKYGTRAARAKDNLLIALGHKGAEEAALIALEKIGAIPEFGDDIIGAFIQNQNASIAATACILVSRTPALAAKFAKYISIHLNDKRGRLHRSATLALEAAKQQQ